MKFDFHGQITAMMCASAVAITAISVYGAIVICNAGNC